MIFLMTSNLQFVIVTVFVSLFLIFPFLLSIPYEILIIIYTICNFYIVRRFRICYYLLYHNSKVILALQKNVPNHLQIELCLHPLLICASICYFIYSGYVKDDLKLVNLQLFLITLSIWIGIFWMKKLTDSEISYLSLVNKLNLGYGHAIWYYKNYLNIILPTNFLMRVNQYKTINKVQLPHKLYILCPKSCKVQKYIDESDPKNPNYIHFYQDLPPFKKDHGGIVDREYNISVYYIECDGKFFRCALEYAQPLKYLLAFKDDGKISLSEMYTERDSFIANLKEMLKDQNNSFEVCELVEYDVDGETNLHQILSDLPSVQRYKSEIKG